MFSVTTFSDPVEFRKVVEPFLLRQEAANNLLIGLINLLTGEHFETGTPVLRAIWQDGDLSGIALRTGDNRALLCTELPEQSIPSLLATLSPVQPPVTRLTCPDRTAAYFAKYTGKKTELRMSLGIYECSAVIDQPPVSGNFRAAAAADLPLLLQWSQDFSSEALGTSANWSSADIEAEKKRLNKRIAEGKIKLWCDPHPVSQVYVAASTPNGARITGVYTPPAARGKGYASACVAELTKDLLAGGKRFVFLFTDMANPTSNRIYQNIGYRFLCTSVDVMLRD